MGAIRGNDLLLVNMVSVNANEIRYRQRVGDGHLKLTWDDAWDDAVSKWNTSSWGGWGSWENFSDTEKKDTSSYGEGLESDGWYSAMFITREIEIKFNNLAYPLPIWLLVKFIRTARPIGADDWAWANGATNCSTVALSFQLTENTWKNFGDVSSYSGETIFNFSDINNWSPSQFKPNTPSGNKLAKGYYINGAKIVYKN